MSYRSAVCTLLVLCTIGCAGPRPPALTLTPASVPTVAIFPPNNRTGAPLLIAGASFSEKYVLPADRFTVADALAAEARMQLMRRGFKLVPPEVIDAATHDHAPASAADAAAVAVRHRIEAPVLYIEIRRWEADAPIHPAFIIASVSATLIDPLTGHVVWSADHPSRPVPTPGVVDPGDAYAIAAHALMSELLADLGPPQPL